jgi:hypothetical protein
MGLMGVMTGVGFVPIAIPVCAVVYLVSR